MKRMIWVSLVMSVAIVVSAEVLGEHCPVPLRRVGIDDRFGTSGQLDTIFESYGLTATNVVTQAEALLRKEAHP